MFIIIFCKNIILMSSVCRSLFEFDSQQNIYRRNQKFIVDPISFIITSIDVLQLVDITLICPRNLIDEKPIKNPFQKLLWILTKLCNSGLSETPSIFTTSLFTNK